MKKLALFAFVFLSFIATSLAAINAVFNYARFQTTDGNPYLEAYLEVKGNSLEKVKTTRNTFISELLVSYIVLDSNNKVVTFEKFLLSTPEFENKELSQNIIDVKRLAIPNGNYTFQLSIDDKNTSEVDFETSFDLPIDLKRNQIEFSDIELISSYEKSEEEGTFNKAGYYIVPNTPSFFDLDQETLDFYVETYNANLSVSDSTKYLLDYSIVDPTSKKVSHNLRGVSKITPSAKEITLKSIDITKLPSGSYELVIKAISDKNIVLAERSISFRRSNPFIVYEFDELEISFVGKYTDKDTLFRYIDFLYPISTDIQKQFVKTQLANKDLKLMQQYFLNFWMERSSENPELAWLDYKTQVRNANKQFGFQTRPGYLTDRGRIYLQYGSPSAITKSQYEPSAYPYEIWQYDQLRNLGNRKLVFYSPGLGMTDYELIHTNIPSEIYNEQWKMIIYGRNNPMGNSIDQTDPVNSIGNRADEYFRNPR
jgi:GWxTD domain-containing protein